MVAADSGSRYRVGVAGNCTGELSNVAVLRVTDTASPSVEVESPSGGEYWLLSEPGSPANEEVVSWSMSDDIRVCSVAVSLEHCDPGAGSCDMATGSWAGAAADCGLADGCAETFGPGGTCSHPGETTTSAVFTVPEDPPSGTPGSLYRIRVAATDHAGNTTEAWSDHPFYIVRSNPESVRSLILWHSGRMADPGGELSLKLSELAGHPRVQGFVTDLAGVSALEGLYALWDGSPGDASHANAVLAGIHDYLVDELLPVYTGVEHLVVVGDDLSIPFARLPDEAVLHLESSYTAGDEMTAGSTVGSALAGDFYLSDDPLAVLDDFTSRRSRDIGLRAGSRHRPAGGDPGRDHLHHRDLHLTGWSARSDSDGPGHGAQGLGHRLRFSDRRLVSDPRAVEDDPGRFDAGHLDRTGERRADRV